MRYYSKNDEEILNPKEQNEIIKWAQEKYNHFEVIGYNRWRCVLEYAPSYPKIIDIIKQRIVEIENLQNSIQEPIYKDSIIYMQNGSKIHKNISPNNGNLIHVRFNVYVQIPKNGGLPIYNNISYEIKERCYICSKSGIDYNECDQIFGNKELIILSYGFLMDKFELGIVIYDY